LPQQRPLVQKVQVNLLAIRIPVCPPRWSCESVAKVPRDDSRPFVRNASEQGRSRTAGAMRHSTIDLTVNVYTDPRLLDVPRCVRRAAVAATRLGTWARKCRYEGNGDRRLPACTNKRRFGSTSINRWQIGAAGRRADHPRLVAATPYAVKEKNPLTTFVNGPCKVERKGVEPSTSALRTQRSPN
jgi:hypothetical protein